MLGMWRNLIRTFIWMIDICHSWKISGIFIFRTNFQAGTLITLGGRFIAFGSLAARSLLRTWFQNKLSVSMLEMSKLVHVPYFTQHWVNLELPHILYWLWWPGRGRMVVMSEVDKIWSAMAPNARPSVPDCHLTNPDFNPNWPFLSPWFCPRIWPPGQAYQSQPTPCIVTFNKDFMTLDVLSCCLALTDLDAKWVVNSHSGATLVFNISFVLAFLYCTLLTHNWEPVLLGFINQRMHE